MDFRADLYAVRDRFDHTERFTAADRREAVDHTRKRVGVLGLAYALVYEADGLGAIDFVELVEVPR